MGVDVVHDTLISFIYNYLRLYHSRFYARLKVGADQHTVQFPGHDPVTGRVDLPEPALRGREARMSEELMDILISEARANKMRSMELGELLWAFRLTDGSRSAMSHNIAERPVPTSSRACLTRGAYDSLHLSHKIVQQRRLIIFSPDQINRYGDVQVGNWKQFDPARTLPSCGLADKGDPESARHQAEGSGVIDGVLNDARRTQPTSNA
jgi:hypothetical protein